MNKEQKALLRKLVNENRGLNWLSFSDHLGIVFDARELTILELLIAKEMELNKEAKISYSWEDYYGLH